MPAIAFALRVWQGLGQDTACPLSAAKGLVWDRVFFEDCGACMSDTFVQSLILDWDCLPQARSCVARAWLGRCFLSS